jgi:carboxylesterase type B
MIRCYRGIRFAEPPTGNRRWSPPVDVYDEDLLGEWAPDCPQPSVPGAPAGLRQSEDCLFLNVWAPEDAEGLPVLVWFFGGSFLFGSASTPDWSVLAAQGCVVVSAAYRVGLFGFLAHPGLSAESPVGSSGNYGLLDNLAALRWVRERIADYGGDPQRITPFGVSAGSAALALLQTSPLAAGAFDGLILQSPGAFRPLAPLTDAEQAAVAAYGPDVDVMRSWTADEVLEHADALVPTMRALTAPRLLRPIRDGWVVPADDRDSYRSGSFQAVPTIVGGSRDEGSSLTARWTIDTVEKYRELLKANFGELADEAFELYPAANDAEVRRAVADVFGDAQFALGARGIAAAVSTRQPQTWRYLYTWLPEGQSDGPHHGGDIGGIIDRSTPPGIAMSDAWVRFAATGDPNNPSAPMWPSYAGAADEYLEFGDPPRVASHWRTAQLDFLERYYG